MHKKFLVLITVLLCFLNLHAQRELQIIDSLKKEFSKKNSLEEKAKIAGELGQYYVNVDTLQSENWGNVALEKAEESRSRSAIVKAHIDNGIRFSANSGKKESLLKSLDYFTKAATIAQKNNLPTEQCGSLLYLSRAYRNLAEYDKALNSSTQAYSISTSLKNDSLITVSNISIGSCHLRKEDKLMALRSYLEAAQIAEKTKNPSLIRSANSSLLNFYTLIKNYDKALDYAFKNLKKAQEGKTEDDSFYAINDLNSIASIYGQQKKNSLAEVFYEKALKKSDSVNVQALKFQSYIGIFNMYLFSDQPSKALQYFNSHPALTQMLKKLGYESTIAYAYAFTYGELNKFDSADYYYKQALPFYELQASSSMKVNFFLAYGRYTRKKGETAKSIQLLSNTFEIAKVEKDYNDMISIAQELDSSYQQSGNFKQALYYKDFHVKLKDSIDKLSKEDEILQLQITDEEKRKEQERQDEEIRIQKRNSIQYLGIVIAIAALFIILAMMGFFKMSERTIRAIGFFSFLMLFEFIFLVLKTKIHHYTHGEPWKDLLALILMAAVLVPLHHWLEHKVIHYLSSRHMIELREKTKTIIPRFTKKNTN